MTKPIIVVKVPCKLLYVIQVKEFLIKCSTSWPYLISEFLIANITIVASDWPHTFLHPRCFCLAYMYLHAPPSMSGGSSGRQSKLGERRGLQHVHSRIKGKSREVLYM